MFKHARNCLLLLLAIELVAFGQSGPKLKTKAQEVAKAMQWAALLPAEELKSISSAEQPKFSNVMRQLAVYADGPREVVDEILSDTGFDLGSQGEGWTSLAPSTKIVRAAKQAFATSRDDGTRFLALLSKRLSINYPDAANIPELREYLDSADSAKSVTFTKATPQQPLPELNEATTRSLLTLASYIANSSRVTEVELADLTPLTSQEKAEIIEAASNSEILLTTLVKRSAEVYQTVHNISSAAAETQLIAGMVKALEEHYPTIKKDKVLAPYLALTLNDHKDGGSPPLTPSVFPVTPKDGGPGAGLIKATPLSPSNTFKSGPRMNASRPKDTQDSVAPNKTSGEKDFERAGGSE